VAALTEQQTGEALLTLNPAEIRPSRHNPRRVFVVAKDEELERSVRAMGVVQPVLVRPAPDDGAPGRYELVCGERRWRAAAKVGCSVPAVLRGLSDAQSFEIALIENLQREDMTPLDESDAFTYMRDSLGYSVEQIAGKASVTEVYVRRRLALQALGKIGRELLQSGKLNGLGAVEVAGLGVTQQDQICVQIDSDSSFTPEQGASRRNVLGLIRQSLSLRRLSTATFNPGRVDLIATARDCGGCPKNSASQRGLFVEAAEQEAICGDPACWSRKTAAAWEEKKATNVDGLLVFVEGAQAGECFGPAGGFLGNPGLIPVDRLRLPSGQLLGEDGAKTPEIAAVLGRSKRTLVRNPDQPDQIVECISTEVAAVIRNLGTKEKTAEESAEEAERRKARQEAKERRKARQLMLEDLRSALDEDMGGLSDSLGAQGERYKAVQKLLIILLREYAKDGGALEAAGFELSDSDAPFMKKNPRHLLLLLLVVMAEQRIHEEPMREQIKDLFAAFGVSEGDALERVKQSKKSVTK